MSWKNKQTEATYIFRQKKFQELTKVPSSAMPFIAPAFKKVPYLVFIFLSKIKPMEKRPFYLLSFLPKHT